MWNGIERFKNIERLIAIFEVDFTSSTGYEIVGVNGTSLFDFSHSQALEIFKVGRLSPFDHGKDLNPLTYRKIQAVVYLVWILDLYSIIMYRIFIIMVSSFP